MLVVLFASGRDVSSGVRLWTILAAAVGAAAWAVPLLVASGGLDAYLYALGAQAGEDFSGVVMLWTHRTPRVAATALLNSFVWPWGWWLGVAVSALALLGAVRLLWRAPRAALVLLVAFGPYAIFHLLFHETETVRYALPLLPPVVYLAMSAVESQRVRLLLPVTALALGIVSLALAIPASVAYAREGAPIFRLFDDMATTAHGGERVDVIAMHASARRAAEWVEPVIARPCRQASAWARVAGAPGLVEGGAGSDASGSRPTPSAPIWRSSTPGRASWCARIAGASSSLPLSVALGPTRWTGCACSLPAGCSIVDGRSRRKSEGSPRGTALDPIDRRRLPGCAGATRKRPSFSAGVNLAEPTAR